MVLFVNTALELIQSGTASPPLLLLEFAASQVRVKSGLNVPNYCSLSRGQISGHGREQGRALASLGGSFVRGD